jgi:hypothetical protein
VGEKGTRGEGEGVPTPPFLALRGRERD